MPLLTSAIVGLARAPLSAADLQRVSRLRENGRPAAELALALTAKLDADARTELPTVSANALAEAHAPAPAQPDCGTLAQPLADYLAATTALHGRPDHAYPNARGLTVPTAALGAYLRAAFPPGKTDPAAWRALGPRGLWLAARDPRFRRLAEPIAAPRAPRARESRLAWLHVAAGFRASGLRPLLAVTPGSAAVAAALVALLDAGRLERALSIARLSEVLFARGTALAAYEEVRVLQLAGHPDAVLGLDRLDEIATQAAARGAEVEAFETHARATLARDDTAQLRALALGGVRSPNPLVHHHPLLLGVARSLDAAGFADLIDTARHAPAYPQGWLDPFLHRLLTASAYPLHRATSEELLEGMLGRRGSFGLPLASHPVGQLDPAALAAVGALENADRTSSDRAHATLLALLARQRLDVAFPVLIPGR